MKAFETCKLKFRDFIRRNVVERIDNYNKVYIRMNGQEIVHKNINIGLNEGVKQAEEFKITNTDK